MMTRPAKAGRNLSAPRQLHRDVLRPGPLRRDVLKPDAFTSTNRGARALNASQEFRMMFDPVFKPSLF